MFTITSVELLSNSLYIYNLNKLNICVVNFYAVVPSLPVIAQALLKHPLDHIIEF